MATPKVGVFLSGCGVFDGSEIYEATFTLLELDRAGAQAVCIAPDIEQMHVIDHLKGEPTEGESRNVLREAARIARGNIRNAADVQADELDALIFPGGFGAAKNLSTFATEGPECSVTPQAERLIRAMHAAGKPLGFMCISPAVAAHVLGKEAVELTIGDNADVAGALEKLGAKHRKCKVDEIAIDQRNNVVTAPAYMYGEARMKDVHAGIAKLVAEVLARAGAHAPAT